LKILFHNPYIEGGQTTQWLKELDAQWAEPVSLTFHSDLRKFYKTFHGASYQMSVQLAKRFQRKSFFWKSSSQKQDLPVADRFAIGSGRNKKFFIEDHQKMLEHLVLLAIVLSVLLRYMDYETVSSNYSSFFQKAEVTQLSTFLKGNVLF
jgi:hypothetical protein